MKVLAIILGVMGVIGLVGSTTAQAPIAHASTPTTSTTTTTQDQQDRFDRPPRMAASLVPVAAVAKPHPAVKAKAHSVSVKPVKKRPVQTHHRAAPVRPSARVVGGASVQWARAASVWKKYPAWVQTFARCVAHHESWSPHMWTAENPISTASGGFQWLDGSWRVNLARAGFRGPGHAAYASPILQAEVTAWVITHHGQRNWAGAGCGYGT